MDFLVYIRTAWQLVHVIAYPFYIICCRYLRIWTPETIGEARELCGEVAQEMEIVSNDGKHLAGMRNACSSSVEGGELIFCKKGLVRTQESERKFGLQLTTYGYYDSLGLTIWSILNRTVRSSILIR